MVSEDEIGKVQLFDWDLTQSVTESINKTRDMGCIFAVFSGDFLLLMVRR